MNNSIFDSLEMVEVTEDDSNDFHNNQISGKNCNQINYFDDPQFNPNLKISCSTKPSVMTSSWSQKSKSSFTRHTLPSRKSINYQNKDGQKVNADIFDGLRKLNDNDKFICQSCAHELNQSCEICNGKMQLTGNDKLIKFFEYVLQFKLGKKQSYKSKQQKLTVKRTAPNQHCSIYFSSINPAMSILDRATPDVRFSMSNDPSKLVSMVEHQQRIKNCKDIHYNYACDQCQISPIQGPRYHCNECGDFDLCEQCCHRISHFHDLEKIQIKTNKKALQKISNLLRVTNQNNLRSSIKNSSSIRNTLGNKACKSWIR